MNKSEWLAIYAISVRGVVICLFLNKVVRTKGPGNRTIQVVIVCIVGPMVLIPGMQKILNAETFAALVEAIIGFAVPRPGKQE